MGVMKDLYTEMLGMAMDYIDHGMDEECVKAMLIGYHDCDEEIAKQVYEEAYIDVCSYHNDMAQLYQHEERIQ